MEDSRNTILAILLSVIVLVAWQYFVGMPQVEKQKEAQKQQQIQQQQTQAQPSAPQQPGQPAAPGASTPQTPPVGGTAGAGAPPLPGGVKPGTASREAALKMSPRVAIETPRLRGSIALKGGRIDDLQLIGYRETVDPKSPNVTLLSPSGSADPFYAEFGWVASPGTDIRLPGIDTEWSAENAGPLTPERPVVLAWDNGQGLRFRRTISIDPNYMFTVNDEVTNNGAQPVTLYNYGLVSRHGTPHVQGFYILHEGLIGALDGGKLFEITYSSIDGKPPQTVKSTGGWLGITDKYWAATLIPNQEIGLQGRFSSGSIGTLKTYQSDFLTDAINVPAGGKTNAQNRLFAGVKEVSVVDGYQEALKVKNFDLLVDWGWFYFITKPLFYVLDYFYRLTGNFGVAILIVTVLIKIVFFPLANKSYASMARMKAVQPQMLAIRDRYADDKVKQQQAMMELYKQEKINPLAGCWPILIQIPVFFALYKVLFVTIDLRHAPFFGWVKDLSAADPTNLFNLFGLLPFDPTLIPVFGTFLHVGIWPLIMGVTMWVQMKMNPAPPDPTQKMIFDWMPVFFTIMLATFPVGLVIYWAWNNLLSVIQQGFIMKKHGAKIELWDNVKELAFWRKKPEA